MGKDINGRIVTADLASMPHVLIAGSTGSGKSVAINAMIMSLLYRTTPAQVRLILVDPKRVELGMYEGIPHLFTPIITEPKLAANALRNAVREMERRLKLLASRSVRNIDQYNKLFEGVMPSLFDDGEDEEPLPYIVIIIDELADLMMLDRANVEESITRLAQMARAVGIHLILATQRPSVDVITGLIKANVPTRISFRLATKVDSRTILDTNGAEALLGRGDMLFLPPGTSRLMRLHAPYVSEKETAAVVDFWKDQGQAEYVEGFLESPKDERASDGRLQRRSRRKRSHVRRRRPPGLRIRQGLHVAAAAPPAHRLRPRRASHRPDGARRPGRRRRRLAPPRIAQGPRLAPRSRHRQRINSNARRFLCVKSCKEACAMRRAALLCLLICLPVAAQVVPIPTPTQLSGNPFAIKKNWIIGGSGNWDYLTIDPAAQRLYIAHGRSVQVVDLGSGSVAGEIGGFREAHAIALDDTGQYGYISDGPAGAVAVFDRRTLEIENTISIGCSPRSIAYELRSKLLLAVCGANSVNPGGPNLPNRRPSNAAGARASAGSEDNNFAGISHVIVIDTQKNAAIADIAVPGDFRFAQADGLGHVYVTVGEAERMEFRNGVTNRYHLPPKIAKFDGPAISDEAQRLRREHSEPASASPVSMDWSENDGQGARANFSTLPLPQACTRPQGLAIDGKNLRLFAACNDQQLLVMNSTDGHVLAALTTGPGDDVIGYDPDRELVFSANGSGYGSLTVIQQDANTDTYAVIQNLATLARARTLAVDASTGLVYLVTDYMGVDLSPRGAFAPIKPAAIDGSFQVLVIGH